MATKKKSRGRGRDRELARDRRTGTGRDPYQRADGVETRATAIHLPVDVHRQLRLCAVEEDRRMSAIVEDALREYFQRHGARS